MKCAICEHDRDEHSGAREDDFCCLAAGCRCDGYMGENTVLTAADRLFRDAKRQALAR